MSQPVANVSSYGKKYFIYFPDTNIKSVVMKIKMGMDMDVNLKNNEVLLQLNEEMIDDDIKEAIKKCYEEITRRGFEVEKDVICQIDNVVEENRVKSLINEERVDFDKSNDYYQELFKTYLTAKTISINENGNIINYVVGNANSDSEYLLRDVSAKDMEAAYLDIINDDEKRLAIENMDRDEVANYVLDHLATKNNLKKYTLNNKDAYLSNDKKASATMNAAQSGDLVNTETGIIKNDVMGNNGMEYQTVSMNGDKASVNSVNAGNVSIDGGYQNNQGNTNSYANTSSTYEQNNVEMKTFYRDSDGKLYDQNGNEITNASEYVINPDDNCIYYNNQKVGYLDDYNTLGKTEEKSNAKKLILEKDNNAGNAKVMILGAILLGLLLIVIYIMTR